MKRVLLTMAVTLMVVLVSCKQNQQLKEMHSEADITTMKFNSKPTL